jgi:hypothetical protein
MRIDGELDIEAAHHPLFRCRHSWRSDRRLLGAEDGAMSINASEGRTMALQFLSNGPDRIRLIEDENTLAAALCYIDLEKRGLVTIDNEDGMLVTITPAGLVAISESE